MLRTALAALAASLTVSCLEPSDGPVRDNTPPNASLRAPVIAELGVPVRLDATLSGDDDQDPLTYIFQWGDGSEAFHTPEAVAFHTFAQVGVFEVLVRVIDIHAAESLAAQDVSIRDDFPSSPDFCGPGRPCVVGDECDRVCNTSTGRCGDGLLCASAVDCSGRGLCYSSGGTLE